MTTTSFFIYADELVKCRREAGRYATADLYRASSNWLLKFHGSNQLPFDEITPGMIDRFLAWLQSHDHLKTNSINSYLSNIRSIYNSAVREGLAPANSQPPFAHLILRPAETPKRAISMETLEEIARLDVSEKPELKFAKDMGLFSFLGCGIPFVDLAHLTRENIIDGELAYNRAKTGTLVRVRITEGMQRLIDQYADPNNPYLFPILPREAEGIKLYEAYKLALLKYNESLLAIGLLLSVPIFLSSYVFRHTWATEALHNDIPVAVISQALGHKSERTTRIYLAALDQSRLDEANKKITKGLDDLVGVAA